MPHNTKQIICFWFLDGFKPESEYYAEVREHFTAKELERIDAILALQHDPNVKVSKKDKAFILYVLTVVMLTSKMGEYEHED
jgi:hypothetical protein